MPAEHAWILNWLLKLLTSLISLIFREDKRLADRIRTATVKWGTDVIQPDYKDVEPENLAETFTSEYIVPLDKSPEWAKLKTRILKERVVPSSQEWLVALVERWEAVKQRNPPGQTISLFQENDERRNRLLSYLAEELRFVCSTDEKLFRNTVLSRMPATLAPQPSPGNKAVTDVISACRRMALFTQTDYENNVTAMFDSIADCRVMLQQMVDHVVPDTVHPLINGVIQEVHAIEALQDAYWGSGHTGVQVGKQIDRIKLRILDLLRRIAKYSDRTHNLPSSLKRLAKGQHYRSVADANKAV